MLSTDIRGNSFGKATNSFEFIKANINMKYINLVPVKLIESGKAAVIETGDIHKLPLAFKTCNTDSRVIDKIDFDKNVIRIMYHNEGVEL